MRIKPTLNKTTLRVFAVAITAVMCTLVVLSAVFPFPEGTWNFLSIGTSYQVGANPDWLTGWSYRTQGTVTNGIADYQTKVQVGESSGVQDGTPVTLAADGISSLRARFPACRYSGTYDRTYFTYLSTADSGSIWINYYDHNSKTYGTAVELDTSLGLNVHQCPVVHMIPSGTYAGYILVAWNDATGHCYLRRSSSVENIASWGDTQDLEPSNFPQIVHLGNGNEALFFVYVGPGGANDRSFGYRTSSDGGASWSATTCVVSFGNNYWEYGIVTASGNTVHIAWHDWTVGTSYRDIYYAYSADNLVTWRTQGSSTPITLPISSGEAELVYDHDLCWIDDIQIDGSGSPVITFVEHSSTYQGIARWAHYAAGWSVHTTGVNVLEWDYTAYGMAYNGGIFIDPNDTTHVVIGAYSSNTATNIQEWYTSDSGATWLKFQDITTGSTVIYSEPRCPVNYASDFKLVFNKITAWTDYDTWTAALYKSTPGANCNGHIQSDFDDLRFTSSDGTTLLDYWIESTVGATPNQIATVWVQNDATPSTAPYMYYGKADATAVSSGPNTFLFFDHFADLTKWTTLAGTPAVASSILTVANGASAEGLYSTGATFGVNTALRSRMYFTGVPSAGAHQIIWWNTADVSSANRFIEDTAYFDAQSCDDAQNAQITHLTAMTRAYHIYEIKRNSTTSVIFTKNDVTLVTHTTRVGTLARNIGFYNSGTGQSVLADWILIRKYAATEPTFAFGSEEGISPQITNTPNSKDFGILEVNTTSNTAISYFTLNNTGNCPVDITIQCTNFTGGDDTWTLSGNGTAGVNTIALHAGLDDADDNFDVVVNTTANAFVGDVPVATTQAWGLNLTMPTAVSGYDGQNMTGNITLVANGVFNLTIGISVSGEICSPSISLNISSWSVNSGSPVVAGSNYATGLTFFEITNNSGGAVTITISGTDMTGGGYTWDLDDDGSPGDMIYALKAGLSGGDYTIIVRETATYNTLVASLDDEATQDFGFKIWTPTVYSDGNIKSGNITLSVICD